MTKKEWVTVIHSDWSIDTGGGNTYIHIGPEGGDPVAIAIVADSWDSDDEIDEIANLISAAPELYEALQSALHMIAEKEGTSDENDAIYDAAKAALSKARGEQ